MNADRLLAHFQKISEAPDAVDRLRRFVLDLAVRGKLVPSKAAWDVTTVGSLGVWGSGGTPSKSHPEYYGGDIPWLVIGDLNDGVVTDASTHITRQGLDNSSAKLIGPGAVLIALYGSIGKLGITGIRCATNQAIAHCIPNEAVVCREYLFLLLRSMRDALLARGQGVAQQNISQKILKAEVVRLPPLAEQHRIVEKVDELMMLCDRLEASQTERETRRDRLVVSSLNRLGNPVGSDPDEFKKDAGFHLRNLKHLSTKPEHIKELRKAILNLAVRGKLVPQDEKEGTASEVFEQIAVTKQKLLHDGLMKSDKKQVASNEPPFRIPESWQWLKLQDLWEVSRGGSPRPAGDPKFFGGPIPWITVGEITKDESFYLSHTSTGLTDEGAERSRFIESGDLLLTNSGATLGVPKISRIRGCINDGVAVLRQFHGCDMNLFAYLYLTQQTPAFRSINQGMGQPNLNTPLIAGWWFPLPPLAEQKRVVAKVDELMAICDQLEQQLESQQKGRRRLLEALLHEALEGVGSG
jgi:type I restriction enzyme S subunit